MESIRELRRICQKPREGCDTWHGKKIARPISIYITIIFLKLGISANFATGIFLFSGICASVLLLLGSRSMIFLGALTLQLWYILDHTDGEVARYKKQTSLTGMYFDHISHYIVHPLIFFCLGFGLFFRFSHLSYVMLGVISGLSALLTSAVTDIYELTLSNKGQCAAISSGRKSEQPSMPRRIFSFLNAIIIFPSVIDILFIFALLDFLFNKNSIVVFIWMYALFASLFWVIKFSYLILSKKLDNRIGQ